MHKALTTSMRLACMIPAAQTTIAVCQSAMRVYQTCRSCQLNASCNRTRSAEHAHRAVPCECPVPTLAAPVKNCSLLAAGLQAIGLNFQMVDACKSCICLCPEPCIDFTFHADSDSTQKLRTAMPHCKSLKSCSIWPHLF